MTRKVYIAPDCPPEVDALIRRNAAAAGDVVMPAQPFPWNRRKPVQGVSYLPGQGDLPGTARDSADLARRLAAAPLRPSKPQLPADVGLFSDESAQLDLMSMFMNPED